MLTGARGTGKSSLIKACLHEFAEQGLRLVEVDKAYLADLADITDLLAERPERFVIFCDDLSFDEGETGYKAMKSALDGSVSAQVDNILIYATSNRRHLLPEYMKDNESYAYSDDGEIHPGEVVEEKFLYQNVLAYGSRFTLLSKMSIWQLWRTGYSILV